MSPGEELLQCLIDLSCKFCFATLSLPLDQAGGFPVIITSLAQVMEDDFTQAVKVKYFLNANKMNF